MNFTNICDLSTNGDLITNVERANGASWFTDGDLISAAVLLSLKLDEKTNKEMKWKMISEVWLEMLLDVASQWKGNEHGQQLRRGGEFLTHVWLLMVHLDLA
ncbi:hypothetical protein HS088_TW13G01564 [Tripterygium wilfordii]|uniref:Uncharacterized protein n=1 Tax=Tripterygium wilfordii TaxID=458696 RepID=A0A7J7CX61_TRIWF|nr:hypothetical protein HS088_TW13G01564 [Tripterygium wilfordii]